MVRKHHKILSVILCLMLVVSAVCVGTMGASAATGDTIYVRVNNGWSAPINCYAWTSGSADQNAAWPGVAMTKVEDDVYSYTFTTDCAHIIFNSGSNQTKDLAFAGNGQIYDLSAGTWSAYTDAPVTQPSTSQPASTEPSSSQEATTPSSSTGAMTVYLQNDSSWSTPYCYMWTDGDGKNAAWPGVAMTNIGGDVWSYVSDKTYDNVIFNNGASSQTSDLSAKGKDGYIYNNSTGSWEVYDTSPLQVLSFTANPSTGIYVGSVVTLSTEVQSKTGATISTKISVTDAKGTTSVLSDYSTATTATWLPEAVGDYTVNFDYKDTEGNENARSLTLTVADDSTLVKPVIKAVTPFDASQIELNQPCTVTVNAGGGHVNTNLLFYKFIITDPNGNPVNTPYYTLDNTFTFTPKVEGLYTVQVFVESSDNSKVNKTYTYGAGVDVPSSSSVVIPTAPSTTPSTSPSSSEETTPSSSEVTIPSSSEETTPSSSVTPIEPTLMGDANGDGLVNIDDVTAIQMFVAKYNITINTANSDMDGSGFVDINDATMIQKLLAKVV